MKNHNGGVICCQGCYRIGFKSGKEFGRKELIEEFEKIIDKYGNRGYAWDLRDIIKQQLQELKSKGEKE